MNVIISLLPLIPVIILLAWLFRLSSRVLLKESLNWKICFVYVLVILIFAICTRLINSQFGPLPYLYLRILVGFSLNVLIGTYLFGKYAKNSSGMTLGLGNGFKVTILGMGFLFIIAMIGATVIHFLGPQLLSKTP
jgi:hypothetical protein